MFRYFLHKNASKAMVSLNYQQTLRLVLFVVNVISIFIGKCAAYSPSGGKQTTIHPQQLSPSSHGKCMRRLNTALCSNGQSNNVARNISKRAGEMAIANVQWLGYRMTEPEVTMQRPPDRLQSTQYFGQPSTERSEITTLFDMADDLTRDPINKSDIYSSSKQQLDKSSGNVNKQKQVWEALASLEKDSTYP